MTALLPSLGHGTQNNLKHQGFEQYILGFLSHQDFFQFLKKYVFLLAKEKQLKAKNM